MSTPTTTLKELPYSGIIINKLEITHGKNNKLYKWEWRYEENGT